MNKLIIFLVLFSLINIATAENISVKVNVIGDDNTIQEHVKKSSSGESYRIGWEENGTVNQTRNKTDNVTGCILPVVEVHENPNVHVVNDTPSNKSEQHLSWWERLIRFLKSL